MRWGQILNVRARHGRPCPFLAGRGQSHQITLPNDTGQIKLIDDSYNANPESVRALLALLGAQTPTAQGRRIAVLGDMLELGQNSARFHSALSSPLRDNDIARVLCLWS